MYPISPLFADYLKRHDREFLIKAIINGEEYSNAVIVEHSIENSLSLSQGFEIGNAIPSKLTIKLRLKNELPSNARIMPYISLSTSGLTWDNAAYPWQEMTIPWTGGGTEWMPLGEFFVDSREKVNDVWVYTCYDKLVTADVAYISQLTYPATMKAVWDEICARLGFSYDSSVQINSSYKIQAGPVGFTCRQMMGYIAGANSASVFVGKDGKIKFKRYVAGAPAVFEMTSSDYIRVKQTNPVKSFTRIEVTYDTEDGLTYTAGTGDDNHTLKYENPFMTQTMVNNLQATLNGFSYLPMTMEARGFPQLEHGDVISFAKYEGNSWLDATIPWDSANIPWSGIVQYQTLILHQVLSFKGGLKLTIEAPSISEQQSEFAIDGSLTSQVNNLNKNAVKEGKAYYGATITRSAGLTIEREDHLSKAVFNSDELSFYAGGNKALWFDLPNRKFKFAGDLEAVGGTFTGTLNGVDGIFTGDLSAVGGTFTGTLQGVDGTFTGTLQAGKVVGGDITGTTINGSTIIGSVLKTAQSGRRIEIDSTSGFRTFDSSNNNRIRITTANDNGVSAISFYGTGGGFAGEINSYQSQNQLNIISDSILIGSNSNANPIYMNGATRFNGLVTINSGISGITVDNISGLSSQLFSLQSQINTLSQAFYSHTHNVNIGTHNHGNPQNQNWPANGGNFTTSTP
ncbi:polymer-forming cytoskeletal protein [Paenibacillus sp. VMFN-D1]|uniref:polymer-forming cytoskeletal protein n=1 Tax=Paenibacillus sp. VMFN-D1 TaxID=2135608 RepID=UPI000E286564|nr:polymer-forming cytoskeletal protein [Paenibacillus sp. VMFN-D1]RED34669.1 hypothetical protein C7820_4332 [Paenibacillus sp. VMFN-D1]